MACTLAADGVALHAAGIGGGAQLAVFGLHGRDAPERPVGLNGHTVPAAAKLVDDVRAEPAFERQRPPREASWVEGRDQVVGVELGSVDRLLEVESAIDLPQEDVEGPLLLLAPTPRPPRA